MPEAHRRGPRNWIPGFARRALREARDRARRRRVGLGAVRPPRPMVYLGTAYGGAAVPVGALGPASVCFCFGAGEDISFELEAARTFGCAVHVFDPTPRAVAHCERAIAAAAGGAPGSVRFHPLGVWSSDGVQRFYAPRNPDHVSHSLLNLQHTEAYFEAECRTPRALMERVGAGRLDLAKLNIEGAEYEVMAALFGAGVEPDIVCVTFDELHTAVDGGARERVGGLVAEFRGRGYAPAHARGAKVTFVKER